MSEGGGVSAVTVREGIGGGTVMVVEIGRGSDGIAGIVMTESGIAIGIIEADDIGRDLCLEIVTGEGHDLGARREMTTGDIDHRIVVTRQITIGNTGQIAKKGGTLTTIVDADFHSFHHGWDTKAWEFGV